MWANFEAARISGRISEISARRWSERYQQWTGLDDTDIPFVEVDMTETEIEGNGFEGRLMVNSETAGTYSGKFFGPRGEEVGGVLHTEDGDTVGVGYFTGNENDR